MEIYPAATHPTRNTGKLSRTLEFLPNSRKAIRIQSWPANSCSQPWTNKCPHPLSMPYIYWSIHLTRYTTALCITRSRARGVSRSPKRCKPPKKGSQLLNIFLPLVFPYIPAAISSKSLYLSLCIEPSTLQKHICP